MQQAQRLNGLQIGALVVAAVGLLLSVAGIIIDIDRFFQVYLVGYLFWFDISLACLGFLMLQALVGGRWSFAMQRIVAAGSMTIPLMAILFLPVLFSLERIYPWAVDVAPLEELANDGYYLFPPFILLRAIIYFAIWTTLAFFLTRWTYQNDRDADYRLYARSRTLSSLGMVLLFLTVTFAYFDWTLSLQGDAWFSSVFGWLSMGRAALAGMAFVILILVLLWNRRPISIVVTKRVKLDLAGLLLVTLLLWIYMHFVQYFVIWMGDQPSKVVWYADRSVGGWETVTAILLFVHAIVLVFLLLPGLKRLEFVVILMAGVLFLMRLVEMFWTVLPPLVGDFSFQWWDIGLWLLIGGAWLALFFWTLKRYSLVPVNHPRLHDAIPNDEQYEAVTS